MQRQTLAGVKSEKMIPNSWMCFSPLTKSHPNLLTTSSDRHPSWPITDSREPPDRWTERKKERSPLEKKEKQERKHERETKKLRARLTPVVLKTNNPCCVKTCQFTIYTWKWISVINHRKQYLFTSCEILSVLSCFNAFLMVRHCLSVGPEIITDLYRAQLPTRGGYLSHTTRRSLLCWDDPDLDWDVPNSGQKQDIIKCVQ